MFKDLTYMTGLTESYLAGTMSDDERKHFEAQMAQDEQLRQDVELHRLTVAALQHHGRRADRELTEAMQGMTCDELKAVLQRQRQPFADVAASIALPEDDEDHPFVIGSSGEGEITPLVADMSARAASDIEVEPAAAASTRPVVPTKKRNWWVTMLAAAAVVTGVWLGARWFYSARYNQLADSKVTDTYIAMRESGEKAMGAARGDNKVFYKQYDELTDTLDIAQVAPQLDSVEVVMQQALFAMRNGDAEDAIKLLKPLYKESGYNKEVGIALAMAYAKAKEHDNAVNTLTALSQRYEGDEEIKGLLKTMTD